MALDALQFRDLTERVLTEAGLSSPAAVNLILGTAAQESAFGTFLRQKGGPALGAFQIEPRTYQWLRQKYWQAHPIMESPADDLEWNLKLGVIACRLRYLPIPRPLPDADDVMGLARYWKEFYNTYLGAGTVVQFVGNYERYVR